MANRFWVGGSATWDGTAGAKWATTSGGAGGAAVPLASDDVFLDAASGAVTVTVSGTPVMRSLTCTGFTGTLTYTGANLQIGDASGGALTLVAGMTFTGNGIIILVSTSNNGGTGWGITTGGKTLANLTMSGAGGKWVLQDNLTVTTATSFSAGTFDTNNKTISTGTFSSTGATTRTFTPGSSAITVTSNGWSTLVTTNLTVTANTATVTLSGVNVAAGLGALNYNGLSFAFTGAGNNGFTVVGGTAGTITLNAVTYTGTALTTNRFAVVSLTCTTLTVTGNSKTNRVLVYSTVLGTAATITAGTVSVNAADFMDVTGAGAGSWNLSAVTNYSGDCGGNSGITFTTPATQTATGTTSFSWSDASRWTSRVPLPQDDVVINAAFSASQTVTADMPRLGKSIDWTGTTGSPVWLNSSSISSGLVIFGSLTLVAGVGTINTGTNAWVFSGRSSHTITSASHTFTNSVTISAPSGTYTLQDALSSTGTLAVNSGTFTTSNNSVSIANFTANTGGTVTLNLGTSTVTLTSTAAGSVWDSSTGATTVNGTSATFIISTASTNTRNFRGASAQVFGTLTYTVANSPGALQIGATTGSGTFTVGTLNVGSGRGLTIFSGATLTVQNWNVNGAVNGYLYVPGVSGNFASTPDSAALSITGDIDIRIDMAMDDWTPAATAIPVGKENPTTNRSYCLQVNTSGTIGGRFSTDGTNILGGVTQSSVATGFTDGTRHTIRITRRASDGRLQCFTASSVNGTQTQLGTDSAGTAGALFDAASLLTIGGRGDTAANDVFPGKIYRVQIRNNILDDGTGIVFDADFSAKTVEANTFTESSAQAATVTINGALAQAGDGRVALTSTTPGSQATLSKSSGTVTANYLTIQDSVASGGASWHAVNSVSVSNNTGWNFSALPNTSGNFTIFR